MVAIGLFHGAHIAGGRHVCSGARAGTHKGDGRGAGHGKDGLGSIDARGPEARDGDGVVGHQAGGGVQSDGARRPGVTRKTSDLADHRVVVDPAQGAHGIRDKGQKLGLVVHRGGRGHHALEIDSSAGKHHAIRVDVGKLAAVLDDDLNALFGAIVGPLARIDGGELDRGDGHRRNAGVAENLGFVGCRADRG